MYFSGVTLANSTVSLDNSFPRYLLEHPERFSTWIRPV
jgi:hypothetical protein